MYADNNYLAIYECFSPNPDGSCAEGSSNVLLLSRDPRVPDEDRLMLLELTQQACFTDDQFVLTIHTGEALKVLSKTITLPSMHIRSILKLSERKLWEFENVYVKIG